jgi:hypothetical protein
MAQKLYLFLTQAEGGAPGYLSRLGESGVENAVDNIESFLQNLGLDLQCGLRERQELLGQSDRVQSVGGPGQQRAATLFALDVHPEVMLLSGEHIRSMKTVEGVAQRLALPVVVDRRVDRSSFATPVIGVLGDALKDLETQWLCAGGPVDGSSVSGHPKVVIVATALEALAEWVQKLSSDRDRQEEGQALVAALREASEQDTIPAVWIAGHIDGWPGSWVSDCWSS